MKFFAFAYLIAISFSSLVWATPPLNYFYDEALQRFLSAHPEARNPPNTCDPNVTESDFQQLMNYLRQPRAPGFSGNSSRFSCEDLFSENPPEILSRNYGSRFSPSLYVPYCTLSNFSFYANRAPGIDYENLYSQVSTWENSLDMCGNARLDRDAAGYRPRSATPTRTTLSNEQKTEIVSRFRTIARNFSYTCCGNDSRCQNEISNTSFVFCSDLSGSAVDECHRNRLSTQFEISDHGIDEFIRLITARNFTAARAFRDQNLILRKVIQMSDSDAGTSSGFSSLTHELAHVCDTYHMKNSALGGNSDALLRLNNYRSGEYNCNLAPYDQRYYHYLYQQQGMSAASIQCLDDVVARSNVGIFPPHSSCNSCRTSYYAEIFAMWMDQRRTSHFQSNATFFQRACNFGKDAKHPASFETLKCFLKTPSFQENVIRISGCRRNSSGPIITPPNPNCAPPHAAPTEPNASFEPQ